MEGRGGRFFYLPGFSFEPASGRLRHADGEVILRPKSAAVLSFLIARAGEVVPKGELLAGVWPEGFVGEAALSVCINELRQVLGDDARRPRFIATAHRRGYQLIAEILPEPQRGAPQEDPPHADAPHARPFVGRAAELAALRDWLKQAEGGEYRIGFVAAQGGVGKTALIERFAATLPGPHEVAVGWGQCGDRFGVDEPYLPVLDALAGLCAGPDGGLVREALRCCAPTWLMQFPGLVDAAGLEGLQRRMTGAGPGRMLREFADAMEMVTAERPLVLILDDLHDSDQATAGLISYLGQRRGPARLLLLGAYRPAELVARDHPLGQVVRDLRSHGKCGWLGLELLSAAETASYLNARLAPRTPSPALTTEVHERTEGNALFVVTVVDSLLAGGLLVTDGDVVSARDGLGQLGLPDEVRLMIERQIESLDAADRRLLAVASAAGQEFSAEIVAAGLAEPGGVTEVEERCDRLARARAVLLPAGESDWPDGTVSARYRFAHEMYRDVCYEQLGGPARRAQVHRCIADRLAAAYGGRTAEVAGELAFHSEYGGDYPAAICYLGDAAATALGRSALREADGYARRALELLGRVPPAQRPRLELPVRRVQVVASMASWSWRDTESLANCERLRALAIETADTAAHVTALLGLHNHATARSDTAAVHACSQEIDQLAARTPGSIVELASHFLHMRSASSAGQCGPAWEHARAMLEIYQPAEHRPLALLTGDQLDVAAHLYAGTSLWQLGYPDQGRRHAAQAVTAAREQEIPALLARALWFAAAVHLLCGDTGRVREMAAELDALCRQHHLAVWRAGGLILDGWAVGTGGDLSTGLDKLRRGSAAWAEFAPGMSVTMRLAAELCLACGDVTGGLAEVRAGLDTVARTGLAQDETELLRLRGELLLLSGTPDAGEAEESLRRAVELAAERQARSFQLRAATSLARLWQSRGRSEQARGLLGDLYGWFTEGHDTNDMIQARTVLDSCAG